MFIKRKNSLKWNNETLKNAEVTEFDVIVLDEEIDEGMHEEHFFQITKKEFDTFAELTKRQNADETLDNHDEYQRIWSTLTESWTERGLESGPIFGARVIRNNKVHDVWMTI